MRDCADKTFIDDSGGCPQPGRLPGYQPGPYCPSFPFPGDQASTSVYSSSSFDCSKHLAAWPTAGTPLHQEHVKEANEPPWSLSWVSLLRLMPRMDVL